MIIAQSLLLRLGDKTLFEDVNFNFDHGSHIALVGRNGTGKTTLLNVIAGEQGLDGGSVGIKKDATIAYMQQHDVLASTKSVMDEALTVFDTVDALAEEAAVIEKELESGVDVCADRLDRYAHLHEQLAELNPESLRVEAKRMLLGLGFSEAQLGQAVSELSVGWKMRVVLAKLLLQKADFYLFDEPTNHLDIFAKDWFLDFLRNAPFGFLLVSHDRFFLDQACDKTYELDRGRGKLYHGNYSKYLEQRAADREALEKAYLAQQREIKQKKETINRFRAKASKAKMAKSMEKSLEKIELIQLDRDHKSMNISFPAVERSGEVSLTIENAEKSFGEKEIFKNVSFELKRGEKAAIVASNGKGKTTLFNLLVGKFGAQPEEVVRFGHNVEWTMFEQDQTRVLDSSKTILQEVEDACSTAEARQRVRSLLGCFLFPGDDAKKKIGVLSGGERNRVAMVKVLLQKANLLLLDEPTNHLDIQSKEILLQALRQFPGTILFVSHDRFFLDELATCIFELTDKGMSTYRGNYEEYLYHKNHMDDLASKGPEKKNKPVVQEKSKPKLSGKEEYKRQKTLKNLESKIARYEKERDALTKEFEDVSYAEGEYEQKTKRFADVQALLEAAYAQWNEMQ